MRPDRGPFPGPSGASGKVLDPTPGPDRGQATGWAIRSSILSAPRHGDRLPRLQVSGARRLSFRNRPATQVLNGSRSDPAHPSNRVEPRKALDTPSLHDGSCTPGADGRQTLERKSGSLIQIEGQPVEQTRWPAQDGPILVKPGALHLDRPSRMRSGGHREGTIQRLARPHHRRVATSTRQTQNDQRDDEPSVRSTGRFIASRQRNAWLFPGPWP